jgi:hypothetical protein
MAEHACHGGGPEQMATSAADDARRGAGMRPTAAAVDPASDFAEAVHAIRDVVAAPERRPIIQ